MNQDSLPTEEHTLQDEQPPQRLDKWLQEAYPKLSRTYFQKLIEEGHVLLNGKSSKKRLLVHKGDHIRIAFALNEEIKLKPEPIPLSIIFEDDHLLVLNKPPGLVVHPAPGNWSHTLVNGLLYYLNSLVPAPQDLRPGIVHRLDKDTSGLILTAKSSEAQWALTEQFANRQVEKRYLAITHHNPGVCRVNASIGRHPQRRKEMTVCTEGREALTSFTTLDYNDCYSFVEARPKTGRTHQIRVHLKHLNCPVVGDKLYGPRSTASPRQLLHASSLVFTHPIKGEKLELTAPLPSDMQAFLTKEGLRA